MGIGDQQKKWLQYYTPQKNSCTGTEFHIYLVFEQIFFTYSLAWGKTRLLILAINVQTSTLFN